MNVRSLVMAMTLSPTLLLTTACGMKERKPSMRRSSHVEESQVTEWAQNVALKGEKGKSCFQLDLLAEAIQNQQNKLISVRTMDLDFVTETKNNAKNKKRRFIYEPESGDLAAQKANYFFVGKARQSLISIVPATALDSTQANELLNVFSHEKCADKVIFADKRIFKVEDQNEKFIRLVSINGREEVREYFIDTLGQIQLTQIMSVNDVATCGVGIQKNHVVRRRLVINLAEVEARGSRTSPSLTALLNDYVYKFNQDKDAKKPDQSSRLNSALLMYMSAQITAGQVQVNCAAANK